ncbi:Rrf2 family transcriptional regulator [Paenibacillus sp. SYP-B3998]|uniref:Rrf2 family transcriptional regulator n=1 Tax=Paenibacillus sp. SYP-B3998 TaxID=2678564 RepID=A0A6G3ZT01_9BACL|nr:Rrf2 family transcriptional regulator [Paenibacillus sp. SYP-B3998]NEW05190.1 Rrf2 family transcriptional regulator [Paenibacillus sp. SYP-B3998]
MKKFSSRFTIGVHILSLIDMENGENCTSEMIAGSININPVIVRKVSGMLKKAGLIHIRLGVGGAALAKPPQEITLLDVYRAVEVAEETELFHFHEHPNPNCPVGNNIQSVLQLKLQQAQAALERELAEVTLSEIDHDLAVKISSSQS